MTLAPPSATAHRRPPAVRNQRPPVSRVRRLARAAAQLAIGALVVVGLAALLLKPAPPVTPPGWRVYRPPHELSALVLVDGVLWAGGSDGLTLVDTATQEVIAPPAGSPRLRNVRGLAVERAGSVWIAHGGGVTRFDSATGEWRTFGSEDGALGGVLAAVLVDRSGVVWAGGERGLARYASGEWHVLTENEWPALESVDALFVDRCDLLWVGSASATRGGLAALDLAVTPEVAGWRDRTAWRTYGTADGLAHNSVNAIREDPAGAIWVATGFANLGGASRFASGGWTTLTRDDGLAGGKVRSLFFEESGRAWFGSEYDGIAVFDGEKRRVLTPRDGLSGWEVKAMVKDATGAYWLATEDGLTRIESRALAAASGGDGR